MRDDIGNVYCHSQVSTLDTIVIDVALATTVPLGCCSFRQRRILVIGDNARDSSTIAVDKGVARVHVIRLECHLSLGALFRIIISSITIIDVVFVADFMTSLG